MAITEILDMDTAHRHTHKQKGTVALQRVAHTMSELMQYNVSTGITQVVDVIEH